MHNKLLKVAALALVLVFGSLGRMVWASASNQPGSFSYPVEMAIRKMGLTMTANEITESKTQMEFAQGQADEMQRLAGDGWDDACLDDDCDPARDQDRDRDRTPSPVPTGEGRGGGHNGGQGGGGHH